MDGLVGSSACQVIGCLVEMPTPHESFAIASRKLTLVQVSFNPCQRCSGSLIPAGFPGGAVLRGNVRGLLLTACYPGISCDVKDSFGQLQGLCDGKNFTIKNSGWSRQNSTSCSYDMNRCSTLRPSTTAQPTALRRGSEEKRPPLASVPMTRS